jgi:cytidylate kinase
VPGVTISAGYGAGGSVIAPMVAKRLGVQLLDRAISAAVAAQLHVSVEEAEGGAANRSFIDRLLAFMSPLASDALGAADADPDQIASLDDAAGAFRTEAERIMAAAFLTGAVVLGRAGGAAFRDSPRVLRVRLFGPPAARAARAAEFEHIDLDAARRRMHQVDHARDQYVRRLYRVSVDDPDLYHVQLDTTVLPFEACAGLIVDAYHALLAAS